MPVLRVDSRDDLPRLAEARTAAVSRSTALRESWSPAGKSIVGFVGRLAPEKHVERLRVLAHRDDLQLVIVGDGVDREKLEKVLPTAVFTGALYGPELAAAYASMDVFVHAGEHETFCQAVQEAMASGLPVIAPDAGGPLRSRLYPSDWTPGMLDGQGRFLPDFSYAGYKNGEQEPPTAPGGPELTSSSAWTPRLRCSDSTTIWRSEATVPFQPSGRTIRSWRTPRTPEPSIWPLEFLRRKPNETPLADSGTLWPGCSSTLRSIPTFRPA